MQHAGRHPPDEGASQRGQHRYSGPQSCAGGRTSVVWRRIEEQIGQLLLSKMLGKLLVFREDQASRMHSTLLRDSTKSLGHLAVWSIEPQNASRARPQNPHVGIEYIGLNLVAVVEGAEHESIFRKADLRSRRHHGPYRLPVVGDEEALREVDYFLRIVLLVLRRPRDGIGNH